MSPRTATASSTTRRKHPAASPMHASLRTALLNPQKALVPHPDLPRTRRKSPRPLIPGQCSHVLSVPPACDPVHYPRAPALVTAASSRAARLWAGDERHHAGVCGRDAELAGAECGAEGRGGLGRHVWGLSCCGDLHDAGCVWARGWDYSAAKGRVASR
jgi:hypothetical protein